MPGNPNEIKLVNNTMANATRRKIMNFLADGDRNIEEIGESVGKAMLDFHLKLLQQASLIELEEGTVRLRACLKIKLDPTIGIGFIHSN